jgi:hypothetical protein
MTIHGPYDQEPDGPGLLELEAIYEAEIPAEKLCPDCKVEPAVNGGRCIVCRGRSMQ